MSFFSELKRRGVIRVAIGYIGISWLAIQVIETLFSIYGIDETIARIIVTVLAIGFVPAMVLAWVFELTPEGIRRDADADRADPDTRALGRRLDRAAFIVLALALGLFAADKFLLDPARDARREAAAEQRGRTEALLGSYGSKSIAVMPFVNMSSDPEQEFFSDGISEELLNLLAQIQDLRVISRTSAFRLKGLDLTVPEIGERLNVEHVLEGSVRKSGDRIRITAQLIEAGTDTHLWSQTYDRDLDDIFAIQDEIAALVVDALRVELLGDMPKVQVTDPLVHELTLRARQIAHGGGEDFYGRAKALLEEALAIDPDYVPALWQLELVTYWRASFAQPFVPEEFEHAVRITDQIDERILAVDPDNALVAASRGWTAFEFEKNFQKAADLMATAVERAPGDPEILRISTGFARRIGHVDVALRLQRLFNERNPDAEPGCSHVWITYLEAQRYDDALAARLDCHSENYSNYAQFTASLLMGDYEAALAWAESNSINPTDRHAFRAMALHSLGREQEAREELDTQFAEWRTASPEVTAAAAAWLGQRDAAFELLHDRYSPHMYGFFREVRNPFWIPLHNDPRWQELVEKSGFTPEAFAAVEFDPALPD